MKFVALSTAAAVVSGALSATAAEQVPEQIAAPSISTDWVEKNMIPYPNRIERAIHYFIFHTAKYVPGIADCEEYIQRDIPTFWRIIMEYYKEMDWKGDFNTLAGISGKMLKQFQTWTDLEGCKVLTDAEAGFHLFDVNALDSDAQFQRLRKNAVNWDYVVKESAEFANEHARLQDYRQTGYYISEALIRALFDHHYKPTEAIVADADAEERM